MSQLCRSLYKRVFLSRNPHTCTLYPMFSLDPSVVGLAPACTCWTPGRTQSREGHNHPIVCFAYLCHKIGEEFVFFSSLYIKLFELSVELAFNNTYIYMHLLAWMASSPIRQEHIAIDCNKLPIDPTFFVSLYLRSSIPYRESYLIDDCFHVFEQ